MKIEIVKGTGVAIARLSAKAIGQREFTDRAMFVDARGDIATARRQCAARLQPQECCWLVAGARGVESIAEYEAIESRGW